MKDIQTDLASCLKLIRKCLYAPEQLKDYEDWPENELPLFHSDDLQEGQQGWYTNPDTVQRPLSEKKRTAYMTCITAPFSAAEPMSWSSHNSWEYVVAKEDIIRRYRYEMLTLNRVFELFSFDNEEFYANASLILDDVSYPQEEKGIHGKAHTLRVLFWCMILAQKEGLSEKEKKLLYKAATFHDCGRTNDTMDDQHGAGSYIQYLKRYPEDPALGFLITYHCLEDKSAEKAVQNAAQADFPEGRLWLLFEILKDADALDRVRLGTRFLSLRYLHRPSSLALALAAYELSDHDIISITREHKINTLLRR